MSESKNPEIVVAGHICLDILLVFLQRVTELIDFIRPGKLVHVDRLKIATGGAVANTGITLAKLIGPKKVGLIGLVADDFFGEMILRLLERAGEGLSKWMVVTMTNIHTSFSVVLNIFGLDRIFLHHPGTNDAFEAVHVGAEKLQTTRIFHFGYPPLMEKMLLNSGEDLKVLMKKAKLASCTTSLDMALPDPSSPAGKAGWVKILGNVLPYVDLFMPSFEEIVFMLRDLNPPKPHEPGNSFLVRWLGDTLLEMGATVVVIKLGKQGLYLRTSPDSDKISSMGRATPSDVDSWTGREIRVGIFDVKEVGFTGAGDATAAAILAGLNKDLPPELVLQVGAGAGASCVEKLDATSGIPTWDKLLARINAGWPKSITVCPGDGWEYKRVNGIDFLIGPNDCRYKG